MQKVDGLEKIINEKAFENCGINCNVIRAYCRSLRCNLEALDFNDIIWEREIPEILQNLKELGIKSFTVSDQSTALMETLHQFMKAGCNLTGYTEVQASEYPEFGTTNEYKMKPALKLQIID